MAQTVTRQDHKYTYIYTYIHTYMHTYIHAYIHTYTHTTNALTFGRQIKGHVKAIYKSM